MTSKTIGQAAALLPTQSVYVHIYSKFSSNINCQTLRRYRIALTCVSATDRPPALSPSGIKLKMTKITKEQKYKGTTREIREKVKRFQL